MSKAGIDIETFEIPCKVYGCNKRAKYKIGNLKGSPASFYHVCKEHAKDIAESLPIELQPTPKEVKVYPTEEELKVLLETMKQEEVPFSEEPEPVEEKPKTTKKGGTKKKGAK